MSSLKNKQHHTLSDVKDFLPSSTGFEDSNGFQNLQKIISCFKNIVIENPLTTFHDNISGFVFDFVRTKSNFMSASAFIKSWIIDLVDNDNFVQFFNGYLSCLIYNDPKNYVEKPANIVVANFIKLLMIVWNVSDKAPSFALRLFKMKTSSYLLCLLNKAKLASPACISQTNIRLLVQCSLGILQNVLKHVPAAFSSYMELNIDKLLKRYIDILVSNSGSHGEQLIVSCMYLLTYFDDNFETHHVNIIKAYTKHLLTAFEDALKDCEHLYSGFHGFSLTEILQALYRLSTSEIFTVFIHQSDIFRLIETTLSVIRDLRQNGLTINNDNSETHFINLDRIATTIFKLLWVLTGDHSSRSYLLPGSNFRRIVESFLSESIWSQSCKLSIHAVLSHLGTPINLMNLKTSHIEVNELCSLFQHNSGHVMLSYQHSNMDKMCLVRDGLIKHGFCVWMDVENMRGSFLDRMVDGVGNAFTLVLGVSYAFSNSKYCRDECGNALCFNIPCYSLLLEPNYRTDGWLGLLIASTDPIPFFDNDASETAVRQLVERLRTVPVSITKRSFQCENLFTGSERKKPKSNNISSAFLEWPLSPVIAWTQNDVRAWLRSVNLSAYIENLAELNGPMLLELSKLSIFAPRILHKILEMDFKMCISDRLRLFRELSDLYLKISH